MPQTDYRTDATRDEPWTSCQDCHTWMMPLAKYEIGDSDVESPDTRDVATHGLIESIVLFIFSAVWESIADWRRKRKLARLKSEVLPAYPSSLACPRCLKVERRK